MINNITFHKGRAVVYCYDLLRSHDDQDRRTFHLEPTLRAVEGRMVRRSGVVVVDAGAAPLPVGAPPTGVLPEALAQFAGRVLVLSESESAAIIAMCDG